MDIERRLGFEPTDREFEKLGYDIESSVPATGKLRFIEVKGRVESAATISVTRNEILYSSPQPLGTTVRYFLKSLNTPNRPNLHRCTQGPRSRGPLRA